VDFLERSLPTGVVPSPRWWCIVGYGFNNTYQVTPMYTHKPPTANHLPLRVVQEWAWANQRRGLFSWVLEKKTLYMTGIGYKIEYAKAVKLGGLWYFNLAELPPYLGILKREK